MKIFCISRSNNGLRLTPGVDSAVLRPGEPVFVPEPFADWRSTVAPAVRLSRLGMNIREKSASAYYDSLAPFNILTPVAGSPSDPGLPPYVLDRAFSPGQWLPVADLAEITLSATLTPIGSDAPVMEQTRTFAFADLQVDSTISQLSRYITFKTGDILVFTDFSLEPFQPVDNTTLEVTINSVSALSIRIK